MSEIKKILLILEKQILKEDKYEGLDSFNELISDLKFSDLKDLKEVINHYLEEKTISGLEKKMLKTLISRLYNQELAQFLKYIQTL